MITYISIIVTLVFIVNFLLSIYGFFVLIHGRKHMLDAQSIIPILRRLSEEKRIFIRLGSGNVSFDAIYNQIIDKDQIGISIDLIPKQPVVIKPVKPEKLQEL